MTHHQVAIMGLKGRVLGTVPHRADTRIDGYTQIGIGVHPRVLLVAFDHDRNGDIVITGGYDADDMSPAAVQDVIRDTGADDFLVDVPADFEASLTRYSSETVRFENWCERYERWSVETSHGWSQAPRDEHIALATELLVHTEGSRASLAATAELQYEATKRYDSQALDDAISDVIHDVDPTIVERVMADLRYEAAIQYVAAYPAEGITAVQDALDSDWGYVERSLVEQAILAYHVHQSTYLGQNA